MADFLCESEDAFLLCNYEASLSGCLQILQSMMGYEVKNSALVWSQFRLPPSGLIDHFCQDQCVCQATVILAIQAMFELKQYQVIDLFMQKCYPVVRLCPFEVFLTWVKFSIFMKHFEPLKVSMIDYIRLDPSERLLRNISDSQRETLIILLIRNCLIPCEAIEDALKIVDQYSSILKSEVRDSLTDEITRASSKTDERRIGESSRPQSKSQSHTHVITIPKDEANWIVLVYNRTCRYLNNPVVIQKLKLCCWIIISLLCFYRISALNFPGKDFLLKHLQNLWKLTFASSFGRHL